MKHTRKLLLISFLVVTGTMMFAQETELEYLEKEVEKTEDKLDSLVREKEGFSDDNLAKDGHAVDISIEIDSDEPYQNAEDDWNELDDYQDWDKTEVTVGKDFLKVREQRDTVKVKIGNKGIKVVESGNSTIVDIVDLEDFDDDDDFFQKSTPRFKGHLSGMDIGINNFVDKDFSMVRKAGEEYMDLNTGKSWNVNIHFVEQNIGIYKDRVGLVTGLGVEFSNYFFDNNNSIVKNDSTGIIETKDYNLLDINTEKSKLATTFLTLPLLMEVQLLPGKKSRRLYISGGIVGSIKLMSHTKVVYREKGNKEKEKQKGDFNISSLRYGYNVRVGFRGINVYGMYYPISIFEKDKGPELYPFATGLSFIF